jgi:peptidoglycan/xylan/chitin deacetylase (PgdA/CDA1 family)
MLAASAVAEPVPDKLVVLTFDDAVKSHRTFVAPLLEKLGFGASFFVTHRWMDDRPNFMTWEEISEIHRMGFEIGNHSWTHDSFSIPRNAARLRGELALVENALAKVGVPRPISFAHCGNGFGPEAVAALATAGYKLARRGITPEVPYEYGLNQMGPVFDPARHHPLLIPFTGISDAAWTVQFFQQVVDHAKDGKIIVLQYHGVPDLAHPWCHTAPEKFEACMRYLKDRQFRVIALRDVQRYINLEHPPADPVLKARFPVGKNGAGLWPAEMEATRADLDYWLPNMLRDHHYSTSEAAQVCGLPEDEIRRRASQPELRPAEPKSDSRVRVLPYPGGRHPRIGFLEGAIDPLRGTKASVFLPWDPASYVVVDLPEAIFSNLGLIFLAHTHVPTIWNEQNQVIQNIDWTREPDGTLRHHRLLPNGIIFGASIGVQKSVVQMELWLRNVTNFDLTRLRTQICVMFKQSAGFNMQTNENKLLRSPSAAVHSAGRDRWIITSWERCGRVWANPPVPCMHADPVLPDCSSGETVRVKGWLWFYEGTDIDRELDRAGIQQSGARI